MLGPKAGEDMRIIIIIIQSCEFFSTRYHEKDHFLSNVPKIIVQTSLRGPYVIRNDEKILNSNTHLTGQRFVIHMLETSSGENTQVTQFPPY